MLGRDCPEGSPKEATEQLQDFFKLFVFLSLFDFLSLFGCLSEFSIGMVDGGIILIDQDVYRLAKVLVEQLTEEARLSSRSVATI